MKAIIVLGSPRGAKGASSRIARQFAAGLRRGGAEIEEIVLKNQKISHCIGCFTCWTKTPGRCVHRDDMDALLPKMKTDLVVLATPLYVYSVPGLVKDFLDRQLPNAEPYLIEQDGISKHPSRDSAKESAFFLICVAGFPEQSHFDAVVAMCKKMTTGYCGELLIGGAEPMSRDGMQNSYAELYRQIEQAGYEVATQGNMQEATAQQIRDLTIWSPQKVEHFRRVANEYWQALIAKAPTNSQPIKIVGGKELTLRDGGMATFLAGMAMQYDPTAIPGFAGVLQFNFEGDLYHLVMSENQCKAYAGAHPEPTMTIFSPAQVWSDISDGTLDGQKALMDGLYRTEGDMGLLLKLDRLFGQEEQTAADDVVETNQPVSKKAIPDHRGPLKLPAMTWMTLAFVPWILHWILDGFAPDIVSYALAVLAALMLVGYHATTNVVTLFEAGSATYLLIGSAIAAFGWTFWKEYGLAVDYIFLGGLWFASVVKRFSLTAEYSRYLFPQVIWKQPSFLITNQIITAAWGGYYLIAAVLHLIRIAGYGSPLWFTIGIQLLLIPMFIFTAKFQQWYPERLMRRP